ncbi:hypothetical protein AQUCO_00700607v1 [Aquilegia coerulea]|uniref:Alpha/beta hydrolase fold-3 domain-containing protein n=1 Tax=Aquilegia coerulea TaxID=218851 RepID=A0A2G5EKV7_AQUCA|nr:hypothetical protein AQUCO_00700607v1 [Aquilegia coerulea]
MDSHKAELAYEFLPYLRAYTDGRIERLLGTEIVPPGFDPKTKVTSKDILILPDINVSARLYLPKIAKKKLPVLVYYHGGAFCLYSSSASIYHNFLNALVSNANVIAVSVNFRLAPERPLPIAYEDSWAALQWVASHYEGQGSETWLTEFVDFNRLFLAGDSSGANIAHNMAMLAGNPKAGFNVRIAGLALVQPYFWGFKAVGSEASNPLKKTVDRIWPLVSLSAPNKDDPRINPVGADAPSLSGLGCKRVLVCVAEKDIFRDRGWLYCETLRKCGWTGVVEYIESKGENHEFHLHYPGCQNAKDLIEYLAVFLNLESHPLSCL